MIQRLGSRVLTGTLVWLPLLVLATAAAADEVDLLIVAGQSNAVGYDAKPSELPRNDADRK